MKTVIFSRAKAYTSQFLLWFLLKIIDEDNKKPPFDSIREKFT